MQNWKPLALSSVVVVIAMFGVVPTALATQDLWRGSALSPLPAAPNNIDLRKVRLGEEMFHDPRLSADDTISCASCHDLNAGGADGLSKPVGIGGTKGGINTPTVFNSAYNFKQFWDGRAESLEEQAAGPVHNPAEMGSNWPEVVDKLNQDERIRELFQEIYPDGITGDNIVDTIATFERTLVTIDAPFDRYLQGDQDAISEQAAHGYELFTSYGCVSCHQGVNVGGNMYQTMGILADYFRDRGNIKASDMGRFQVTGRDEDRHVFKVPSLRVVKHTAPYFHDGSAKTLDEAVKFMAKYQLGRDIPDADVKAIVAFLESLAGEYMRFDP
ncbi:cytochrome-c peroxidase [Magnetovibrio sp. PR-2]|uniref:cytochrome-c peroxidase n=1 Tax=Magnetovibrio sp. PR-2 TaxID=3120356 RepID=UPI002FCE12F9